MKKILFTCILSTIIFAANAQVNKGAILLGGNIGLQHSKTENGSGTKQKIFFITPSIGFAYKTNRVAGFSLGYGTGNYRNGTGSFVSINRYNEYSAGAYLRRYFPIGKNFSLFGEGDLSYQYRRTNVTDPFGPVYIEKQSSVGLFLTPGIGYSISKKVMLEAAFGNLFGVQYSVANRDFTGTSTNPTQKTTSWSLYGTANPTSQLTIGFRFLLNNR
jgi:hypothetical protein